MASSPTAQNDTQIEGFAKINFTSSQEFCIYNLVFCKIVNNYTKKALQKLLKGFVKIYL